MSNQIKKDSYYEEVILRGDEASGSFKDACFETSENTTIGKLGMLNKDGSLKTEGIAGLVKANKIDIDGAGNKPRIYCNQFEFIFQSLERGETSGEEAKKQATELRYRLLMDLFAMNADDLRNGEVAVHLTNIIDINHLKGLRGHLFQDSMADAMRLAIQKVDIPMTAGETAVLGANEEARKIKKITLETIKKVELSLEDGNYNIQESLKELISNLKNEIEVIGQGIGFNIGGTTLGYNTGEKLVDIESRDTRGILVFEEQSENGIIGPRANGITKIIEDMIDIMGEGRENKTFEDFVGTIGEEKASKIPESVHNVCKDKKMRDIATGTTTVFNKFISRTLLGGIYGEPKFDIAKLIHVTGNPLKKISAGVDDKNYKVNIDMNKITVPQIITLLQIAKEIPDGEVMNKFNMGVPYAILYDLDDTERLISLAQQEGLIARNIGTASKSTNKRNIIKNVGLNNSNIEF